MRDASDILRRPGHYYSNWGQMGPGGGLFVPSTKRFSLGDEVFLLLTVMEFEERLPIPGKVVWITPQGAAGNRKAGIGVQFADTQDGAHARTVIESHLASMLKSNVATHTM